MSRRSLMRHQLVRGATLLGAIGFALLVVLIGYTGLHATLGRIPGGMPAIPAALAVHLTQLLLCGLGWRMLLPPPRPSVWHMFRARWLREAVNSILPVGSIGGAVIGARLLTRDAIEPAAAAASVTGDLTGEAASQVLFLLSALALAASLPHAPLSLVWTAAVALPLLAIVISMITAQALGLYGWVERQAASRLPPALARLFTGLQSRLEALYAHKRRVAADVTLNLASWVLGSAEVWLFLRALGRPVSPQIAYVIESLGLVGRSLAFAVPAGLAAQEAGFVLAGALFGIPHDIGLAISLLKRVRELIVGLTGVLYWQWLERRVWLR